MPSWHGLDLLPIAAVLSFSISYGLSTSLNGFYHRLGYLGMDWLAPYLGGAQGLTRVPAAPPESFDLRNPQHIYYLILALTLFATTLGSMN